MAKPKYIGLEQLANASLDAESWGLFINGDEFTDVITRLGRQYPTIAKWLKESMMSSGWKAYQTEAELLATVPDEINTVAYAFDTKKLYIWNGSEWIDEGLSSIDLANAYTDFVVNSIIISQVDSIDNYALAVVDENNHIGLSLNDNGEFYAAGITHIPTNNNTDIVYSIVDEEGNIAFGLTKNSTAFISGNEFQQGNITGIVDEDERVSLLLKDGDLYQQKIISDEICVDTVIQPHLSAYEENGDIFIVNSGEVTQITNDGMNKNPSFTGDGVVFLSKKQRGIYKQYQYKNGVISRYHPSSVFSKYCHILLTGQSLAEGLANVYIDRKIVWGNYRIAGVNAVGTGAANLIGAIAPLQEVSHESIFTGFGVAINAILGEKASILTSGSAKGGAKYSQIKKNGDLGVFENCISQVNYISSVDRYAYTPAIFVIHGEADGTSSNTEYDKNLREWLDDFNNDIRNIRGSSSALMLTCQTSSASGYKTQANRDQFTTPFLQLKASNENPDIFLVGPKYQYQYKDYAHILAADTRHLGEMYAKIYKKVVIDGEDWKPLQPINFTVLGNKIVIDFHVPVEPLQFDTEVITAIENQGFELTNSNGVTITSVDITSGNQVTVTCSDNVINGSIISYAFYNGTTASTSGRVAGSRGALKDSDNTQDQHNYMLLNNWCVIFKQELII